MPDRLGRLLLVTLEAARVEAEAKMRELNETIAPPKRRVETPTTTRVLAFEQGRGFAPRDVAGVSVRWEEPVVDLPALRRAKLELPQAELALLDANKLADAAERALADTRRSVWECRLPASDGRVRSAVHDFGKDLERLVGKAQLVLAVIDAENQRLGRDEHGRQRYHASELSFPPLTSSDPRVPSLAAFWRDRVTAAGWIE